MNPNYPPGRLSTNPMHNQSSYPANNQSNYQANNPSNNYVNSYVNQSTNSGSNHVSPRHATSSSNNQSNNPAMRPYHPTTPSHQPTSDRWTSNQSINQSNNQTFNQAVSTSANRPGPQQPSYQTINHPIIQSNNPSINKPVNQSNNQTINESTAYSVLVSRLAEWLDVLLDIYTASPSLRKWSVSDLQTAMQWATVVQSLMRTMTSSSLIDKIQVRWEQLKGRLTSNLRSKLSADCLIDARSFLINQLMQHPYLNATLMQVVLGEWVTINQSNKQSNDQSINWRRETAESLAPLIYLTASCNQAIKQSNNHHDDQQYGSLILSKTTARITKKRARQELARLTKSQSNKQSNNQSINQSNKSSIKSVPASLQILIDMAQTSSECLESICWCVLLNDSTSINQSINQMNDQQLMDYYQSLSIENQTLHPLCFEVLRSFEPDLFERVRPSTLALLALFDINQSINQLINEPLTIGQPNSKRTFFSRFNEHLLSKLTLSINELANQSINQSNDQTINQSMDDPDVEMIPGPIGRKDSDAFDLDMLGDQPINDHSIKQTIIQSINQFDSVSVVLHVGRVFDCFRELLCVESSRSLTESIMLRQGAVKMLVEQVQKGIKRARSDFLERIDPQSSTKHGCLAIWDAFEQALNLCD